MNNQPTAVRRAHATNAAPGARARRSLRGVALGLALAGAAGAAGAEPIRHPLPNGSTFPIAQAVEVPTGMTTVYLSGVTPTPADPKATPNSPAFWGDTRTQATAVFTRMKATLEGLGLGFGDVVSMTVYLVGDPALGGRMDFTGFMAAYSAHFGTAEQPRLPSRSTVQVAGLVAPGMLVEVEVTAVRPVAAAATSP